MISPVKPTWQRPHPFNLHQPAMPHLRPTSSISLPLASLLLGLALSVAGCSPKTDTAAETPAEAASVAPATATPQAEPASTTAQASASAASSPEATAAAVTLVKGIYTWGPEVETFSPCNTNKTYWLEGSDAMLAPLQEMALKKADAGNEAYQPIYVELQAAQAGKATDGFAADYDGLMQLHQVVHSSSKVPATCKLLD